MILMFCAKKEVLEDVEPVASDTSSRTRRASLICLSTRSVLVAASALSRYMDGKRALTFSYSQSIRSSLGALPARSGSGHPNVNTEMTKRRLILTMRAPGRRGGVVRPGGAQTYR